ncbi:hypothetical protein GCM10027431_32550 [Lysobacter rhizosphaerae]
MTSNSGPNVRLFGGLTVVYLAIAIIWICYRWPEVDRLQPNTVGDLAAGLFSPLAFLWLLYAALAQRAELELQRNELQQNNLTQAEQQAEMRRQADALEAQTRRLNAQADATYQPVFVLSAIHFPLGRALFEIVNRGADVLDAHGIEGLSIQQIFPDGPLGNSVEVRGNMLAHWPKGGLAYAYLEDAEPHSDQHISMRLTRLDLVEAEYEFRYIHREARLKVLSIS